jgi:hypothetical protein
MVDREKRKKPNVKEILGKELIHGKFLKVWMAIAIAVIIVGSVSAYALYEHDHAAPTLLTEPQVKAVMGGGWNVVSLNNSTSNAGNTSGMSFMNIGAVNALGENFTRYGEWMVVVVEQYNTTHYSERAYFGFLNYEGASTTGVIDGNNYYYYSGFLSTVSFVLGQDGSYLVLILSSGIEFNQTQGATLLTDQFGEL